MLSWAQDDNVASPEQMQCIYTRTRDGDTDDAPSSGGSLTLITCRHKERQGGSLEHFTWAIVMDQKEGSSSYDDTVTRLL